MVLFGQINKNFLSADNVFKDIIGGLENWCIAFNNFFLIFCGYLKYIFVFIILTIGIFTLLKLRGVYSQSRSANTEEKEDYLMKPRLSIAARFLSGSLPTAIV